jgi:hypothetical protein
MVNWVGLAKAGKSSWLCLDNLIPYSHTKTWISLGALQDNAAIFCGRSAALITNPSYPFAATSSGAFAARRRRQAGFVLRSNPRRRDEFADLRHIFERP